VKIAQGMGRLYSEIW